MTLAAGRRMKCQARQMKASWSVLPEVQAGAQDADDFHARRLVAKWVETSGKRQLWQ